MCKLKDNAEQQVSPKIRNPCMKCRPSVYSSITVKAFTLDDSLDLMGKSRTTFHFIPSHQSNLNIQM